MNKTTVYLPDDLKAAVKRTAGERGVSEAEVIRSAIIAAVRPSRPRPRGGLFKGDGESIAANVDLYLEGFGER